MQVVKNIITTLFLLVVLTILGLAIYLETSIDQIMSKNNQERLFSEIEATPALPNGFYKTVEKYDPEKFQYSIWEVVFRQLALGQNKANQCQEIYLYPLLDGQANRFSQLVLALELEDRFSQKKCFEYNMHTCSFGQGISGIKEAALAYFEKDITDLDEEEICSLLCLQKAPFHFNPRRNIGNF